MDRNDVPVAEPSPVHAVAPDGHEVVRPRPEPVRDRGRHALDDVRVADDGSSRGHLGQRPHERHGLIEYADPPGRSPEQLDPAGRLEPFQVSRHRGRVGQSQLVGDLHPVRGYSVLADVCPDGLQDLFLPFRQLPHRVSPRPSVHSASCRPATSASNVSLSASPTYIHRL